ncbi:MAG: 30S ribosomal protein S12 methylthiotransferase RimO [Acidimicrobiia bacterium]|nr:30S ribosomal protein S12 methylthiotransferase RimO [Acidimicrobiia bacterium]
MAQSYWIETLGCPKNQVDSDKLTGTLTADGLEPADSPDDADVVVINTCAFIEEARQESIDTILAFDGGRKAGSRLVVTGCLAERYGDELSVALPEVDSVAPFGASLLADVAGEQAAGPDGPSTAVPVTLGATKAARRSSFDLLELPRPAASAPWAYVKVAEGCDRNCGFCAIPSFRGKQRSRSEQSILAEIEQLGVAEVVLVAQDLAAYGRDQGRGERRIVPLVRAAAELVHRVRLLYLYPSDLGDELIDTICGTGVPYFDLSLQHVSPPLMRRMRRWGDGTRFAERIEAIRAREPAATFRSNFIVGYPGETEADHDLLLGFVEQARLDWCGFFAYSEEEGTHGATLDGKVPPGLRSERLAELRELQDRITAESRAELVGERLEVLVDDVGRGRSVREAPEIDGIITVDPTLEVGSLVTVTVEGAEGPDLHASAAPDANVSEVPVGG